MIIKAWTILLVILPLVESLDRTAGFFLLVLFAILLSLTFIKKKIWLDSHDLLFVLFLFFVSLSSIFSTSILRSLSELLRYYAIFVILVCLKQSSHRRQFAHFFSLGVIGSSLLLIFAYVVTTLPWIKSIITVVPPDSGMNLFYPVFGHNRIADILLFSIPISFGLTFIHKRRLQLVFAVLSVLLTIVLFTSYSRGSIIALLASGCLVYLLGNGKNRILDITARWLKPFGIIALIFLTSSLLYSNIIASPSQLGNTPKGFYKPVQFEKRLQYWKQALVGLLEKPLFGSGLDTFRYVSLRLQKEPVQWSWYTHNHFLQLFSEVGVTAASIFTIYIFLVIYNTLTNQSYNHESALTVGIFIGFLASSLSAIVDFGWQFHSVLLYVLTSQICFLDDRNSKSIPISQQAKFTGFFVFYFLVVILVLLPIDGETLITKAVGEINQNELSKASATLAIAQKLDNANSTVFASLGALSEKKGNTKLAHMYYDEVLKRNPFESFEVVKNDFKLYLKEAQTSLKASHIKNAIHLLSQAYSRYPYIHREIHGNTNFEKFKDVQRSATREDPSGILGEYISQSLSKIDHVEWNYR